MSITKITPSHTAAIKDQFVQVELLETKKRLFRSPKYRVAYITQHMGSKSEVLDFHGSPIPIPGSKQYDTVDVIWVNKLYPLHGGVANLDEQSK